MQAFPVRYAALAQDTALAPFLRAGVAVILWSQEGERIVWASDEALEVVAAIAPGHEVAAGSPLQMRLAAIAGKALARRGITLEKLELGGESGQSITCACQVVPLPEGGAGLLTALVGRQAAPPRPATINGSNEAAEASSSFASTPADNVLPPPPPAEGPEVEASGLSYEEDQAAMAAEFQRDLLGDEYVEADAPLPASPSLSESAPEPEPELEPASVRSPSPGAAAAAPSDILDHIARQAALRPRRRFTFASDAGGRIVQVSADIEAALGSFGEGVEGSLWQDLVDTRLAPAEAMGPLAGEDTFSLRDLSWRLGESGHAVALDLSGVAIRDVAGRFGGFRGFGVLRLNDIVPWTDRADIAAEADGTDGVGAEAADSLDDVDAASAEREPDAEDTDVDGAVPEAVAISVPLPAAAGAALLADEDHLSVSADEDALPASSVGESDEISIESLDLSETSPSALSDDDAAAAASPPEDELEPTPSPEPSTPDDVSDASPSDEPSIAELPVDEPALAAIAPADPASEDTAPAEGPEVVAPPAHHALALVTARLREWSTTPVQGHVSADWVDPAAADERRSRSERRSQRHDLAQDLTAWATDAIARFGEVMSNGDRLVADMREKLAGASPPAESGTTVPTSAPSRDVPREAPRDGLSDSDRQALREIARALGERSVLSQTPPQADFVSPTPEPGQDSERRTSLPDERPAATSATISPTIASLPAGERGQERLRLVSSARTAPPAPLEAAATAAPEPRDPPADRALTLRLAAREAEARELASILDTATDGVVVIDERGRILSLNRSAEALFGYDKKEVTGEPFTLLLATESHPLALDYLEGLRANGVASILNDGRDVFGRVRQGGRIPLFMTLGRIADGPERKFCAVLRDMTAWKKAEGELIEARRAAEKANSHKSDFLATISHEIRTPLNAIIGFAEIMLDERFGPVGNDRYKDYLRDIHSSGGHVISLVNDLLDLAKIEAGRLELEFVSVDVNDIVRNCVSLLQAQANRSRVVLRMSLAANLPPVVADARSLRQIALNILSNAVKFTDAGGQVIVSTALTDRGELALRVRDTGIGMSDSEVKAALEPFRQLATSRRGGGTGLGLPLTKALVEANRGAFVITSAKSEGTLVEILFPPTRVLAD